MSLTCDSYKSLGLLYVYTSVMTATAIVTTTTTTTSTHVFQKLRNQQLLKFSVYHAIWNFSALSVVAR